MGIKAIQKIKFGYKKKQEKNLWVVLSQLYLGFIWTYFLFSSISFKFACLQAIVPINILTIVGQVYMIINIIAETIIALCQCVFLDSNEDSDSKGFMGEIDKFQLKVDSLL